MEGTHKTKMIVSLAIVAIAILATVGLGMGSSNVNAGKHDGILVDFGDRDAVWTNVELDTYGDAVAALEYACAQNGFDLQTDAERNAVEKIKGLPSDGSALTWNVWTISVGGYDWTLYEGDPGELMVSDHSCVVWSLTSDGETPSVSGVDQTGVNFYGYGNVRSIITLAPSITEMVCAVGGSNMIVGVDQYSNYPDSVVKGVSSGRIAIVGSYTTPNFEQILSQDPDLVFCDGGQSYHMTMAEKLRKVGINVIVLYGGDDVDTIYENIHIAGSSIGFDNTKNTVISAIKSGIEAVNGDLDASSPSLVKTLVSLSAAKSPWVSGSDTYIHDVLTMDYAKNVFDNLSGWRMVNSEKILQVSPEIIIVVSSSYSATPEGYQRLLDDIESTWTDGYLGAKIYLICESACDLVSRPGPRLAQITELIARIVHGPSLNYTYDYELPYYIGDDYEKYLGYTKGLGFND